MGIEPLGIGLLGIGPVSIGLQGIGLQGCSRTHLREISLSVTDILFGKYWKLDDIDTLNFIIPIAKYYINKCRYNNKRLQINNFRKYLLFWYKVEKQVEFTNCKWEHFDKRWNLYYHFINIL